MQDPSLDNTLPIEDLFTAALEHPREERAAFLDGACLNRPEVRAELDSLLAAYDQADNFLEVLDPEQARSLIESEGPPSYNRIGPYQVVHEIGRGGMGAVYLAERADGQFEQQVALKLVKRGMDSDAILKRFLYERQILARLHHPNIARLLDGGMTEKGQPYFALEYIEGMPLTHYCDTHQLSVEARLRLFQDVCQAVQYAHRNLIVHRDLKPSNILVTEEGTLKLLDFGIAKLLDTEAEGDTLHTEIGLRALTPEYAAPEQVQGDPITTATDVYALGVLLYELLTGHRPYTFKRRAPDAVAQVLRETEPARPSTAVGRSKEIEHGDGTTETITPDTISKGRNTHPDRLRRRLTGDLDTVILKALRKGPEQRYASAEAFLEDIRRHMAGLPVNARPVTLSYRASKFIQRHKVGVAAGILVLLSLLLGLAGTTWQAQVAAQEAAKAEEVKEFVLSLFEVVDPDAFGGEAITARALLDAGATRIETELANQPEVQAEMLMVVGEVYQKLGAYEPALPLIEQALSLRKSLHGPNHLDVVEALIELGVIRYRQGDYAATDSLYQEALTIQQEQLGQDHLDVAEVLNNMAVLRWRQGDYAAADSLNNLVLDLRRQHLGPEHLHVAITLTNLGVLARTQGNYEAAEARHQEALTIRRSHFGEKHRQVAESLKNLALTYHSQSRYPEAEALYRESLAIQKDLYEDAHPEIATTLNSLASLLRMKGDYDQAEPLFREALTMRRELLGPTHPSIATTLGNLADLYSLKGAPDQALPLHEEALAMRRTLFGDKHPSVATSLNSVAVDLRYAHRYEEALAIQEEVLQIYQAGLGASHPWVALALNNLGAIRFDLQDYEVADSIFQQALAIQQEALSSDHVDRAIALMGRGRIALAKNRPEEAEPLLREALALRRAALPPEHWRNAEAQNTLGACLSALGQRDEGERLLLRGYERLVEARGEKHFSTRAALSYLVDHYERYGTLEEAAAYRRLLQKQ